jgi:uncharacterized cupin superfamily protein
MLKITVEKPSKDKLRVLDVESWSNWECDPSVFQWEYTSDELSYILEGTVIVTAGDDKYKISAGDFVTFPKGLKCEWDVKEKLKKLYTFR